MGVGALARFARAIFTGADLSADPEVLTLHDQPEIALSSQSPLWVQVDGEPLVQATTATLRHIPNALTILG
jgi:diacylglycerol kinase family enzyme